MKDSDWIIINELYKNPNITRVANLLFTTQPSITKRIHKMEDEFGVRIVERNHKGVEFTKEGEYLAKQAQRFIELMNETKEGLEVFNHRNMITIGTTYTFGKYSLTEVLYEFNRENPQIEFSVVNDESNVLFRKLLEGEIDCAFVSGDYEEGFNRKLVERNQGYIVTKDPVSIDEIEHMQRIEYMTNEKSDEIFEKWWRGHFKSRVPSGLEVGYIDLSWQLISKGLGYTYCFLPKNFVNDYGLSLLPLMTNENEPIYRNTWFIYGKDKEPAPSLRRFIEYIER